MEENKFLNKKKVIFHVDVNNAYLSWTAVELLKESKKDIRNIPSIIGGDEKRRSGVVLARSIHAKKLGVKTGEPVYFALKKVPNLEIYPPNYLLYEQKSEELNNIFLNYTEIVEKYSIDESFLDITDYLFGKTPLQVAKELKEEIYNTLGFTVNIGISDSKMLAKTASDFKKPNMIHTLFTNQIKEKLWPLDISSLFTVGRKMQEGLRRLQINTIGDIAKFDSSFLEKRFGKHGLEIWKLANGIDNTIVNNSFTLPKSISNSETLVSNTKDLDIIKSHIMKLTEHTTTRLRNYGLKSKTVRLTLRTKDFKDRSKQRSFENYTDNTSEIFDLLLILLKELISKNEYRLIGVSLENLCINNEEQLDIFETISSKDNTKKQRMRSCRNVKEQDLDFVLDDINKKYSSNIIKRARNMKTNNDNIKKDS